MNTEPEGDKNLENAEHATPTFREGDEVVLAQGTYPGVRGVFLRLKEDAKWADITERDGEVRSHPVEWLAHWAVAPPGLREVTPA
jgi:hypothetical protein